MLTEFSIGNYQAFSTPQRVPLKPITLIFGPNSAGKSALLRSLLVARHAILNGKLSNSEGAGERHPGSYADMARNGNSNPINFEFAVQSAEGSLELGVSWREKEEAGLETVALTLKRQKSGVACYSADWISKQLQIGSLGEELRRVIEATTWESDTKGSLDEVVFRSVKRRLALQKGAALPGLDMDDFRNADNDEDDYGLFIAAKEMNTQENFGERFMGFIKKVEATSDAIKKAISLPITEVDNSVRNLLSKMIYHGPIRPICDEVTKARKSEPGMMHWWNLAADPKLLAKVNNWLAGDIFKTKYRLEFDRLFPDSSLRQLLQSLSSERSRGQIVEAAFEAKLDSDKQFYESLIEPLASDMEADLENEYEGEDERRSVARQNAHDAIYNDCWDRGMDYYNSLLTDSDVEEIEAFLLVGFNKTLAELQGMLESVRQGQRTKTPGGFDSAKIHFYGTTTPKAISPSNMGIGFSQMMPLVASAFGSKNRLVVIEQPELHIHPALQMELADLFIESVAERNNRFLIETHSEHLILRVLRRVRETNSGTLEPGKYPIRQDQVAVLYVEPGDNGSEVVELPVTEDGDFAVPWPNGFFAERADELF